MMTLYLICAIGVAAGSPGTRPWVRRFGSMNAGRWSGMIAGGRRRRLKRGLVASAARVIIVYGESVGKPGEEKQNTLSRAWPGA